LGLPLAAKSAFGGLESGKILVFGRQFSRFSPKFTACTPQRIINGS
jgi:hypothetical protein